MSSRSNADVNVDLKREAKLKPRTTTRSDIGPNISKLKSIIKLSNTTTRIKESAIKNRKEITRLTENLTLPILTNGECYSLREAFSIIEQQQQISPSRFYNLATNNPSRVLLIYSRTKMYSKYTLFKKT